jgi:hypothetical protein
MITYTKNIPGGLVLIPLWWLSGHPAIMSGIDVDRKAIESKKFCRNDPLLTRGCPWGVSYAATLHPDDTGIGNWTEEQFLLCAKGNIRGWQVQDLYYLQCPGKRIAT